MDQQNWIGRGSREFVCSNRSGQGFPQIHKKAAYTMYGQVLQFRPFRTNHALMCKLHEQDKVSVLKHVLCSLLNVSDFFFRTKMFNIVIIKK